MVRRTGSTLRQILYALVQALETGTRCGIANLETTWHGFAEAIFAGAVARGLLTRAPALEAIGAVDYPTPARRPAYSCLDTRRLRADFGLEPPEWRAALSEVLDRLARAEAGPGGSARRA